MEQLEHVSADWPTFPIFLKATAGMRELPLDQRVAVMAVVSARCCHGRGKRVAGMAVVQTYK